MAQVTLSQGIVDIHTDVDSLGCPPPPPAKKWPGASRGMEDEAGSESPLHQTHLPTIEG